MMWKKLQNVHTYLTTDKKESINQAIEEEVYHNNLLRKLEEEDEKQRRSLNKKMEER